MERTLVLIKPDGVKRKLMGEIISFYERKDLNIVALKMLKASKELAEEHYREHKGRSYFEELIEYITEGNLCAMIVEGKDSISIVRNINGGKDPKTAPMGSIRGTYANDTTKNLVHASDNVENAEREISIWFSEFENY
ncbi:nucleoside-diphosphate kinase [Clostridium arbusti]|uniref:nucleoside-diphosphate kinase n=1 Tax=Clostridium arbusti TaxID=1137848 RepID=UPI000287AD1F|nr:nucleoside-diphosphate kinase [Clostridium arbusti]